MQICQLKHSNEGYTVVIFSSIAWLFYDVAEKGRSNPTLVGLCVVWASNGGSSNELDASTVRSFAFELFIRVLSNDGVGGFDILLRNLAAAYVQNMCNIEIKVPTKS